MKFEVTEIDRICRVFEGKEELVIAGLNKWYSDLNMSYPKFFKMSTLCKLGFLAVESLVNSNPTIFNSVDLCEVATIFYNKASSISSDLPHMHAIEADYALPSPANFVYTLPNILNGELAIRHKWTGINAFFISNNEQVQVDSIFEAILYSQNAKILISGLVEADTALDRFEIDCSLKTVRQNS